MCSDPVVISADYIALGQLRHSLFYRVGAVHLGDIVSLLAPDVVSIQYVVGVHTWIALIAAILATLLFLICIDEVL